MACLATLACGAGVFAYRYATHPATLTLAANLLAVEMPGRTFFEVRQILRICCAAAAVCPAPLAGTLQELDGHAHR